MSDAAIELDGLRFRWPRAGADSLAIERLVVARGERLFLHGPSGCGKSTLLALLAGVLLPRAGRLAVLGTDWASLSAARRDAFRAEQLGVLFQQFNLLPWLSVLDNVLLGCRFSRARAAQAAHAGGTPAGQARALLERVGIDAALWPRAARELSVGQQQRVAAARALIGRPGVLIADEPTSALDAALRDGFMDLLRAECHAAGSTLVFVSHDERLAAHFDRVLALPALNGAPS
ncbi:MAG: ATP-binding cassette domain-containing protein [Piscinibacter sp.]|nr:ATP-binding cassette domain-containing protein [Piscinibacter sp.]